MREREREKERESDRQGGMRGGEKRERLVKRHDAHKNMPNLSWNSMWDSKNEKGRDLGNGKKVTRCSGKISILFSRPSQHCAAIGDQILRWLQAKFKSNMKFGIRF